MKIKKRGPSPSRGFNDREMAANLLRATHPDLADKLLIGKIDKRPT